MQAFHKSAKTKELIEKAGCYLLFLPKYSTDLSPIEHCWANLKNYFRKIIDKYPMLKTCTKLEVSLASNL